MGFLDYYMPGLPRYITDEPDMGLVARIRESATEDNGQTLESSMLLPCPFCGGRPFVQTFSLGDTSWEARVVCRSCHVATSGEVQSWRIVNTATGEDITRLLAIGKAISSWNQREPPAWRRFADELPPVGGGPVLCRSRNGALYVGKPVTVSGEPTREVWVPRGAQYRTPEYWREI